MNAAAREEIGAALRGYLATITIPSVVDVGEMRAALTKIALPLVAKFGPEAITELRAQVATAVAEGHHTVNP